MKPLLLRVISLPAAGDGFPSHRSSVTRVKRPACAQSSPPRVLAVALIPSWRAWVGTRATCKGAASSAYWRCTRNWPPPPSPPTSSCTSARPGVPPRVPPRVLVAGLVAVSLPNARGHRPPDRRAGVRVVWVDGGGDRDRRGRGRVTGSEKQTRKDSTHPIPVARRARRGQARRLAWSRRRCGGNGWLVAGGCAMVAEEYNWDGTLFLMSLGPVQK